MTAWNDSLRVQLAFVERTVRDEKVSIEWYAQFLDREPILQDKERGFSLFDLGVVHLALKQGAVQPPGELLYLISPRLSFDMDRLGQLGIFPTDNGKVSHEGYRRFIFTDPDGLRIGLFEMVGQPSQER